MTVGDDLCVYTALFGRYEAPNPQPMARGSRHRWICFTDDPELRSDDWEIVVVEPAFPLDAHRSSREVKVLGHHLVHEFSTSLWIDNSVILEADPGRLVDEWLGDAAIAFAVHSYRDTVLDEFLVVLDDQLDDPSRILEQLDHYARARPDVLDERPLWGGVIARRTTDSVAVPMRTWWNQLVRYSRRDQLSVNYALAGVEGVARISIDNFKSPLHRWPVAPERRGAMRTWNSSATIRRPLGDAVRLDRQLSTTRADLEESQRERRQLDEKIEALQSELAASRAQAEDSKLQIQALAHQADSIAAERDRWRAESERLRQAYDDVVAQLNSLRRHVADIEESTTWRAARTIARMSQALVGPLRLRRVRGRDSSTR